MGKSEGLINELKNLASKKKVGNQDIDIKTSNSYDHNIISNIIYFSPEITKPTSEAASKNKNKGTLIVAEAADACKNGASLNFVVVDSKLKFEYNKNAAVKAGLETKEDFKALALKIID